MRSPSAFRYWGIGPFPCDWSVFHLWRGLPRRAIGVIAMDDRTSSPKRSYPVINEKPGDLDLELRKHLAFTASDEALETAAGGHGTEPTVAHPMTAHCVAADL